MIASFIDGRVRLRTEALKNPETLSVVENAVKAREGVLSTRANPRTGSLLVEYDPERISREDLLVAAELLNKELGLSSESGKEKGPLLRLCEPRSELLLLGGSLGITLLGGLVSKRLHLAAGGAFLLFCGKHLYDRRRRFPLPRWATEVGLASRCACKR